MTDTKTPTELVETQPIAIVPGMLPAPVVGPTEIKATREIKSKINRLREIRAIIKPLEEEAATLTAEILTFVGSTTVKRIMWGKTQLATIVNNVNRRNDATILKTGWPEAYEASLIEKPFQQIR